MDKMWYTSKTMWVNIVGVVAIMLQSRYGYVMSPEIQVGVLGVVNIVLRTITKSAINWD